jgi:hypothetical protein
MQLVFCLACLCVAVPLWLRISYAWQPGPRELLNIRKDALHTDNDRVDYNHLTGALSVRIQGHSFAGFYSHVGFYVRVRGRLRRLQRRDRESGRSGWVSTGASSLPLFTEEMFALKRDSDTLHVLFSTREEGESQLGQDVVLSGRIFVNGVFDLLPPVLDTRSNRLDGSSIAGLVIGVMGCFIFGLYLRGWLRERKALASEPPQDMIA